jgi:hypothetical protein
VKPDKSEPFLIALLRRSRRVINVLGTLRNMKAVQFMRRQDCRGKVRHSVLLCGSRTRFIEIVYPNRTYILSVSPDVRQVQIPLNMIYLPGGSRGETWRK